MAASNQLLTISMITAESARVLSNNLTLAKCVNRDYDDEFGVKGAKIGQTVNVRKPARYTTRTGSVVELQAQTETYAPLVFSDPVGIDVAFTSQEMTFSLDDFSSRVVKPAVIRIANDVDALGFDTINQGFMNYGTPGTALTSSNAQTAVLKAAQYLYDNDAPVGSPDMHFVMDTGFNALLSGTNITLFNPQRDISDIYVKGMQGSFGGFSFYLDQLTPSHTVGTYGGSPVANSATPQTGSSIITAGWTATSTSLNVGDIITFAGVYGVNPQTQRVYSWLQPFTVTAKTTTDGSGNSTISISPSVVDSGPFQNVSQAIPNNATITVLGASGAVGQQSVGFHKDAIMLANVDLDAAGPGATSEYIKDDETGIGMRVVQQYDIRSNLHITRFDTMVAWATLYPQLMTRVYTA